MTELQSIICFMAILIPSVIYLVSLIHYRIDDRYLRMYWGPLPVRKISIDDISAVERGYGHMCESWTNTIWMPTILERGVTLHRKTGGFRRVVLTPDDPDGFIERIRNHRRYSGEDAYSV